MGKQKSHTIEVYNCSNQMIPLQLRTPNSDFYANEQQVRINPGARIKLPKSHVREEQISNLQSRRMLKVLLDTEVIEDRNN